MSLPELPDEKWTWEAKVHAEGQAITVKVVNDKVTIAERTIDAPTHRRSEWGRHIEGAAFALWKDMAEAAKLGVDMGIWVEVV